MGTRFSSERCQSVAVAHTTSEEDEQLSQSNEECLRNNVILRKIFGHFSNRELVKLSLVNKLWCFEARNEIKKRGSTLAKVYGHKACHQLINFGASLENMNIIPFSGMKFQLPHGGKCRKSKPASRTWINKRHPSASFKTEDWDPMYDVILRKLSWKKISLCLWEGWEHYRNCPVVFFVKKVLQDFCEVLEEVSLEWAPVGGQFSKELLDDGCKFTSLKIVKIQEYSCPISKIDDLKALVSRAPNLLEVHFYGRSINFLARALEESRAVIMCAKLDYALVKRISEKAIWKLRVKSLHLSVPDDTYDSERFHIIFPKLLQVSCPITLESMYIDECIVIELTRYRVSLPNVRRFHMSIKYQLLESSYQHVLKLIKSFDFNRLLPKLTKVDIVNLEGCPSVYSDHLYQAAEWAASNWVETWTEPSVNIRTLTFRGHFTPSSAQFFSEVFPAVEKLENSVHTNYYNEEVDFRVIWKHWMNLRELEIRKYGVEKVPSRLDFDSAICGIFPAEVRMLREKDVTYLNTVHIVPVMPAITCMKNLETLTLQYDLVSAKRRHEAPGIDPQFFPSFVTRLIAFARLPNLNVNLQVKEGLNFHKTTSVLVFGHKGVIMLFKDEDLKKPEALLNFTP